MKKFRTLSLFCSCMSLSVLATNHEIDLSQGNFYSPDNLTVLVGDSVSFVNSPYHPTTHVSQETWNANGSTPIDDALFESVIADYSFVVTTPGSIYYVCDLHVGMGMKGVIYVEDANGVDDISSQVSVNLGASPIRDGILNYEINAPDKLVKSLSIYSLNGQQIASEELDSSIGQLAMKVPAGIYLVLLRDNANRLLHRQSVVVH